MPYRKKTGEQNREPTGGQNDQLNAEQNFKRNGRYNDEQISDLDNSLFVNVSSASFAYCSHRIKRFEQSIGWMISALTACLLLIT